MIKVTDLVQHYGVRPVLCGVNFEVNQGEVVAVMGPNGMGKSTLLAAIAGLLSPQGGSIEIAGRRRRGSEDEELAIRRMVAYLPDQLWIPLNRTGREWLLAIGRLYDRPEARLLEHLEALLELFHLQEKADSPISSFSTGQRKKIELCAALIAETPIMILDEPFSGGLDPSGILALRGVLQQLAKRDDRTIILATPVPELVEELADRILLLRDGKILAYDTVEELCRQAGAASLQDAYEKLTDPQTVQTLQDYFQRFT